MKLMLTIVMALTSLVAFGQEKQPEPKKTVDQLMSQWRDEDNKRELARIDQYIGFFQDSVNKFKTLAEERANGYKELNEALTDGDPVLVKKAVSDIHSNAYAIKLHAESQKRTGDELQGQLESAFSSDLINKARYLELRNMVRNGIAETDKKLPNEYVKLAEKAKLVVPDYFAILEMTGRPFGQ